MEFEVTQEDARIAWLVALAIAIHILEASLPSPWGQARARQRHHPLVALHWYGSCAFCRC
ncbi:MAG: hypothetical protein ACREXW_17850 [Gammaproteobacteria bacterium]